MPSSDPLPHSAAATKDEDGENAGGKWRPYEGPMGGEGWENVETGEIRYQDDPPGETVVDEDQQDEFNEEGYTDDFLSAVQNQYGTWTLQFAEMATQPDMLLADPSESYIRNAMFDNFGKEWLKFENENHRPEDGVDSLTAAAIAYAHDEIEEDADKVLYEISEEIERRRQDDADVPPVPHDYTTDYAWSPGRPEYEEYSPQKHDRGDVIHEHDAILYVNEDDEWESAKIDRFEGGGMYTTMDGETILHNQIKAWTPVPENEAIDVGSRRIGQGDWVIYEREPPHGSLNSDDTKRAGVVTDIETDGDTPIDRFTVMGDEGVDTLALDRSEYYSDLKVEHAPNSLGDASIDIVERDPPEGFDEIERDGLEMDPQEVASEITDRVEFDKGTGLGGTRTQPLSIRAKRNLKSELKRFFHGAHVSNYYDAISEWKRDSISEGAMEHADAFAEALDIESATRGWRSDPDEAHVQIARVMHEISREFWEDEFGSGEATLYRGISNDAFEDLMDRWLEDPEADEYDLKQNALNNYTASWDVANSFANDTATIEVEVEPDDVALATDYMSSIAELDDEAEIHVIGDDVNVDTSGSLYTFGNDGPDLTEPMEKWTAEEHDRFAEWLMWKYRSGREGDGFTEAQYDTLMTWVESLRDNHRDLLAGEDEIRELVEEIERDAITIHRFGLADDQTTLEEFKSDFGPIDLTNEADQNWMAEVGEKPSRRSLDYDEWREFREANRKRRQAMLQYGSQTRDRFGKAAGNGKWQPYEGPQGGQGWQHVETGEVRYQEHPPSEADDSSSDSETPSSQFESVDFSRSNEHGVLDEEEQAKLRSELAEKHGEETVDEVYYWMEEWKAHRETDEAIRLGVAMSRALDMDESEVKSYDSIDPETVTDEHVAIARDLHEAGQEWFVQQFGDSASVYRGFKDDGERMFEELLGTDDGEVTLSGNTMDNWSLDREIAEEWGRDRGRRAGAIVETDRERDEFVMTIDGIAGRYPRYNDSAITFDGEATVSIENVAISDSHGLRDREADGYEWIMYEGDFFPGRPLEEQDDEAIGMFALWLDDGMLPTHLGFEDEYDKLEQLDEIVANVRQYLDDHDEMDDRLTEAAESVQDDIRRRLP